MPIQITQHILNLKEEKFAAPWAITIDKITYIPLQMYRRLCPKIISFYFNVSTTTFA